MVKISGHTVAVALLAFTTTVEAQDKKGSASPPPTATVTKVAPAAASPGGFDIGALLAKQIKAQQAELKDLIAKHVKDSAEVRKALQALREIEQFAKRHSEKNAPVAGIDAAALAPPTLAPPTLAPPTLADAAALAPTLAPPGASVPPAGADASTTPLTISRAEMRRSYLRAASLAGEGGSDLDRGEADPRRTAMEGLEFELRSLSVEIRNAKDEAVKNAKSEELREIAETVVVLRSRYRERAIKQLEDRLAALKAEQKSDSVEALIGRLVPQNEKPAAEAPKKEKEEKKERESK